MITQGAGFPLRKFVSNSPQLIAGLPEDHRGEQGKKVLLAAAAEADRDLEQPEAPLAAALGCKWEHLADRLSFSAFAVLGNDLIRVTKRVMLSITARIFDPLGYLAPIVATPKILIQETWADKAITWDTPLQERLPEITQQFIAWTKSLTDLKNIAFARCVILQKANGQMRTGRVQRRIGKGNGLRSLSARDLCRRRRHRGPHPRENSSLPEERGDAPAQRTHCCRAYGQASRGHGGLAGNRNRGHHLLHGQFHNPPVASKGPVGVVAIRAQSRGINSTMRPSESVAMDARGGQSGRYAQQRNATIVTVSGLKLVQRTILANERPSAVAYGTPRQRRRRKFSQKRTEASRLEARGARQNQISWHAC